MNINDLVNKEVSVTDSLYTLQLWGILNSYTGGNKPLYELSVNDENGTLVAKATFMEQDINYITEDNLIVLK